MSARLRILAALLLLALAAGCARNPAPAPAGPVNEYRMKGSVVRLHPDRQVAVIKHEKIDGWMEAMTMEFPVKNKVEFETLKEGMVITAKVFHRPSDLNYWIEQIQPAAP